MKKILKIALLGLIMGSYGQATFADIKLVFGTYAADKPSTTVKKFKPFLDYLSAQMTAKMGEKVTIKMKIAKTYEAGVQQLVDGTVDFSRFGPASYVTAKNANSSVNLIAMESVKGEKVFKGVIAVHTDSPLKNLSDLKGKNFAFGDQLSTIGRYLAQQQLINAGVHAGDLSGYEYLGRHDRVGAAVGNGSFHAGAMKSSTFKKMKEDGVPIRILVDFDNVTKPWISSANMPANALISMRNVMMENSDADAIKSIVKSGFLVGSDSDYDIIRIAITSSQSFGE